MIEQKVLEEAITVLSKHRRVLGDVVVETAVSALQDQVLAAGTAPLIQQFESVTVLQADISGFTALSARLDAEQVSDAINALWQRLDNVVMSWGGQIEQHTGDGLIALFGVPLAQEDDAQRAILAALDMQLELALFNEATAEPTDTSPLGGALFRTDFRMRIGVHSGPLLWGRVGQSLGETAVGDTVQIVGRLEKMCPLDGVLISYDVYRQVFGLFDVEPGPLLPLPERRDDLPVYVVKNEKTPAFQTTIMGGLGIQSGFVGRVDELQRLEFAWQETFDNSVMQVVVVTGEPGIGKSRLFDTFERWLDMMPVRGSFLRAQSVPSEQQNPYATLRQLFMNYFEINRRSTLPVVLEKFSRGIERNAGSHKISAQEQAHVLGQLLGFDFWHSPYVKNLQDQPEKLKKYGLQDLVRFFQDLVAQTMPIVIVIEDAQWADAASLDAIEYLVQACYDLPILVVCLARPEMIAKRPLWNPYDDPLSPYLTLPVSPLSAIDSRHLVADIFSELRHVPFKLSDLLVYGAQGNPFYLEQMVYLLYDDDIIQSQDMGKVVNLGKLDDLTVPQDLSALFKARLDLLSPADRQMLEAAAVIGRVFWDDAIRGMLLPDVRLTTEQVQQALGALEQKGLLVRQRSSMLAGASEFAFVHDTLQAVVLSQIEALTQKVYHRRLADWLTVRMKIQRLTFFDDMIADHYEKAGQMLPGSDGA